MPMAMAAMATGIMLKVMLRPMGMGMFTYARTIKIATSMASSVILAILLRLLLLLLFVTGHSSVQAPCGCPSK